MNSSELKSFQLLCFLVLIGPLTTGCSQGFQAGNGSSGQARQQIDLKDPGNPNADPSIERTIEAVIKTIQPTLAVRGISCLMCHADIRSNVVSDFGYGNAWYLGGAGATLDSTQSWFNNLASTWQSARNVTGTVYIPDAEVTRSAQQGLGANYAAAPLIKLKELMSADYRPTWNFDNDPAQIGKSMSIKIMPAAGKEKLEAKSKIVSRAPDESEIIALPTNNPFVNMGAFFMNDEARVLECAATDLVVKGTLYLKKLQVNAAGGCRIYVTGSIFVEDAITYLGAGANSNLQLTSANGIFMGVGLARLRTRLINDSRGVQLGWSLKSYSERANQAVAEATTIAGLRDAQDHYTPRATVNYTGILLNAPMVHSRYLGKIQGTIIAETALFALGEFHFIFDPVFTKVDVLPLLTKPILEVQ